MFNVTVIPHFLLHHTIISTISAPTSSRPEVFCKKGVLRTFANFLEKHPCQGLLLIKLQAFLWILWNFWEHLFSQNTSGGCLYPLSKQFPPLLYCFFWIPFFKLSKTFKTFFVVNVNIVCFKGLKLFCFCFSFKQLKTIFHLNKA